MLVINLIGIGLIGLIAWWFWFYKPAEVALDNGELVVTVEGGSYSPAHLKLSAQTPAVLTFLRKDASPCAEVLMIPELDINQTLPLNEAVSIALPALAPGEYAFHCQMQMYRGVLNVQAED